jgi:phosphoribosyl-ATP pyrophosphohydrolase/phosphoribosyl-AMP cyclohydrolase
MTRTPLFTKSSNGLLPAIIQDAVTGKVLMLGYMNEESLAITENLKKVTFFSRSKNRLWTKGEESGNYLLLKEILVDCDNDTILVKATPTGPVCHTGSDTCFDETNEGDFLITLEKIIDDRFKKESEDSYVSNLYRKGINKMAQKVGEEAVELVIEAKDDNKELFLNEAADLFFHLLILMKAKECSLEDIRQVLRKRHK